MEKKPVKSVNDLTVYSLSYELALEVFELSKSFPKEELYSLTDQLKRASRSVPANIREGFAKRRYCNIFRNHLITAIGSCEETMTWLDFAQDFSFLQKEKAESLKNKYREVGAMLFSMISKWKSY